eukprot:TRINITY_DN13889_c0_g1_i1.p1 TRINITY_DN13889_c0_g1~~TRINITY_DN13889_c0_g1_i1.p1  ORF type:complete len:198 (+),score=40.35 TRINITY_DN13889_c0_g1_i1:128-721(+)
MGIGSWIAGLGFIWLLLNALLILFRLLSAAFYAIKNGLSKPSKAGVIIYNASRGDRLRNDALSFRESQGGSRILLEEFSSKCSEKLKETGALPELEIVVDDEVSEDLAMDELKFITKAVHDVLCIAVKNKVKGKVRIRYETRKNSAVGSGLKAYYEHIVSVLQQENDKGVFDISLTCKSMRNSVSYTHLTLPTKRIV